MIKMLNTDIRDNCVFDGVTKQTLWGDNVYFYSANFWFGKNFYLNVCKTYYIIFNKDEDVIK